MPSIGFGSKNERRYSNIVFSILIGAGTAIAWRRRGLFLSSQQLSASSHSVGCSELAAVIAVLMISWILLLQIFRSTAPTTVVSISGRNSRLFTLWLGLGERLPDCDAAEPPLLSEYGWPVLVICDGVVLLQLCDADHIRLWGNYAANQDCTCAGRRRSCHGTTLSRCSDCTIDWHGDHLYATKTS